MKPVEQPKPAEDIKTESKHSVTVEETGHFHQAKKKPTSSKKGLFDDEEEDDTFFSKPTKQTKPKPKPVEEVSPPTKQEHISVAKPL